MHKISRHHWEKVICDNKNISITDSSRIRVYSKRLVEDLISNGIVPNKTYSEVFPVVKENLLFDFLRCYIDGDGCIYVGANDKQLAVHITSANKTGLEYLSSKLFDEYGIKSGVYTEKEHKHRIMFTGYQALLLLDKIYYQNDVLCLKRKHEKYMSIKGSPKWQHLGNKAGKIGEGCDANTEVSHQIA